MYTPVNPSFTIYKWGFRGSKLYGHVFVTECSDAKAIIWNFVAGTLKKNLVDFTVKFWQLAANVFTVNLRSPIDYLQEYSCMAGQIREDR